VFSEGYLLKQSPECDVDLTLTRKNRAVRQAAESGKSGA